MGEKRSASRRIDPGKVLAICALVAVAALWVRTLFFPNWQPPYLWPAFLGLAAATLLYDVYDSVKRGRVKRRFGPQITARQQPRLFWMNIWFVAAIAGAMLILAGWELLS